MIRPLDPDELLWFLARAYAFMGHVDPQGFAARALVRIRDPEREAERCLVLERDDRPRAGVHVLAPEPGSDDQRLTISLAWHEGAPGDLTELVAGVLRSRRHEAAAYPLFNVPAARAGDIERLLAPLGFAMRGFAELEFPLSEVPPLGAPLVLEAWTLQSDPVFRELFERSEGRQVSDAYWSWLKRRRSPFTPDLWFLARETLDQDPVGYAFCGRRRGGVEGTFVLTAAGVLPQHRNDSEMVRRLLLSTLHELAARSPLGRVSTVLGVEERELERILRSLGFEARDRYRALVKLPE